MRLLLYRFQDYQGCLLTLSRRWALVSEDVGSRQPDRKQCSLHSDLSAMARASIYGPKDLHVEWISREYWNGAFFISCVLYIWELTNKT